jgi:hypothetical protein
MKESESMSEKADVRIVVLNRGWVAVGLFSQVGLNCRLDNAFVIRRWGTTEGLGQLAEDGPTPDTKLDRVRLGGRFNELTSVFMYDCDPSKWGIVTKPRAGQ